MPDGLATILSGSSIPSPVSSSVELHNRRELHAWKNNSVSTYGSINTSSALDICQLSQDRLSISGISMSTLILFLMEPILSHIIWYLLNNIWFTLTGETSEAKVRSSSHRPLPVVRSSKMPQWMMMAKSVKPLICKMLIWYKGALN